MSNEAEALHRLAARYGVETEYIDYTGKTVRAGPEALVAVLHALGAPIVALDDIPGALREATPARERAGVDPGVAHRLLDH
ncbi:MAG: 4-alpha-glucanotransferase, partial [Acidobacteriota bacterium]|nr:4-alpha-glucanotransferase [Acidobacteriota bacterium]